MRKTPLDYNSSLPLYQQVHDILMERIQEKVWKPGQLIPTEQELIDEFSVSRTTIRQAVSALVQGGLLEKHQGKGTLVRPLKLERLLDRLTGFAEEVMEEGYHPHSKLLRAELHGDLYMEKKKLNLKADQKVVVIERIRFANDQPVALERTCWPEKIGKILLHHDLDGAKFYQILEENGVYLKKAHETISASNATLYEADLLGISAGESLLEMKRLSYGMDGQPIEYTRTKYRADLYHYKIELHR